MQAQDAAAAAALFLPDGLWRDILAFTWNIQTMSGRAAIAATLQRDARAHQADPFPHSAKPHAAALGQPRRHRVHRDAVCIRHRRRPLRRRGAARSRSASAGAIAGLDAEHQPAGNPRPRRSVQAARHPRPARHARFRRRELARPPEPGARLCGSRSRRPRGRRRPGRPVDRRAPAAIRRRYADRRPPSAHRRQLAQALSFADAAQRDARQSSALHAVPADLPGLYPEGQARELVRSLCRKPGAELLARHRARRRRL